MSTIRLLTLPLWLPFWVIWNVVALIGKAVVFTIGFLIKVALLLLVLLIVLLLWWW